MASLKEMLMNNAEMLLGKNLKHASTAEIIESMPDHCQLFIDAENAAPPQQVRSGCICWNLHDHFFY